MDSVISKLVIDYNAVDNPQNPHPKVDAESMSSGRISVLPKKPMTKPKPMCRKRTNLLVRQIDPPWYPYYLLILVSWCCVELPKYPSTIKTMNNWTKDTIPRKWLDLVKLKSTLQV